MTQQIINIGSLPNDGTGDPLRTAYTKTNENFTELYNAVAQLFEIVGPLGMNNSGNSTLISNQIDNKSSKSSTSLPDNSNSSDLGSEI